MTRSSHRWGLAAILAALAFLPTSLPAAIIATGRVSPDITQWTSSTRGYVADYTPGSVLVDGGSQLTSLTANLGHTSSLGIAKGTVTVTGPGSKWTNGTLYIDAGSLTINAGGQVSNADATVGQELSLISTATVSGTGSKWVNSGSLMVGDAGNGSLLVEAGGQVSSASGSIGYTGFLGSTGAATVTGADSKWINSGGLYVGDWGNGSLTIEAGGQVSNTTGYLGDFSGVTGTVTVTGVGSTWSNSGELYVGRAGVGVLTIEMEGRVSNTTSYLGANAGSTGSATVSGTGSNWTNSSDLYVGRSGTGSLLIESGSQVSNATGYLGHDTGSTGVATVTGTGSKWINSSTLFVGSAGSGTLTVADGGEVVAHELIAAMSDLLGNGTITATHGAVLDVDYLFDAANGTQRSFSFGSGGILTVNANGGSLGVGYKQSGSLAVTEGVNIASINGFLGYHFGSTGTATVTGVGSTWSNSSALYVGRAGVGVLTIEMAGQVSDTTSYLGADAGSTGSVTVSGEGSNWTNSGDLYVGKSGSGAITIEAGGQMSHAVGYLGYNAGSSGTAVVRGANSRWTNSSGLNVGRAGAGTLTIEDGGEVITSTNITSYLGYGTAATGAVTVTGAGSKWTNSGGLSVGSNGDGRLTIQAGGQVTSAFSASLGSQSTGTGTALVTGAGSNWTSSGPLTVGASGVGTLTIETGGYVSNSWAYLGEGTGSTGTATVTGEGTKWTNSGNLFVGDSGNGTLLVESGGQVSCSGAYIGHIAGSTGTATVTGTGSKWTNSSSLYLGRGTGTLTIEAGGQVSTMGYGYVGYGSGSTSVVTVTGAGSKWTIADLLTVGTDAGDNLTVSDGGEVVARELDASLNNLFGDGTITATKGAFLETDLVFSAAHGNQASIPFGSGGTLTVIAAGGDLGVSDASLIVSEGVAISSADGYLGYRYGSTGTALITGAGSTWTNSRTLTINQNGSLTVDLGGASQE